MVGPESVSVMAIARSFYRQTPPFNDDVSGDAKSHRIMRPTNISYRLPSAARRIFSPSPFRGGPSQRPIRAAAAQQESQQGLSSPAKFAASRKSLNKALDAAVQREDYAAASLLKQELEQLNREDPFLSLQTRLQHAIETEAFEVRQREDGRSLFASCANEAHHPCMRTSPHALPRRMRPCSKRS